MGGPSGSGLERPDSLVRLAEELGIADQVRFVPPVAQDELVDWYAASTLVCVPSYNESFGLVAIEAQASGHAGRGRGGRRAHHGRPRRPLRPARRRTTSRRRTPRAFERVLLEPGLREQLAPGAPRRTPSSSAGTGPRTMMLAVYAEAQQKMRADLTGIAL